MKQTIQLGAISAVNIGMAFVFQWYVLTELGPGIETDALFAGMTIPQLVTTVISGSLMHVLVPILSGEDENRKRQDAWGFFILIGGIFAVLAAMLYVTARWWIPFTVPGFSEIGLALTVDLTRIQLIGMVFAAINGVQWAAYHAQKRFVWAEFTPLLVSAIALLLLIWSLPLFGVKAAAWIGSLRMCLQTLVLCPGMGRPVWPNFRSITFSKALQRIKPLLLGAIYYKTDPMLDRFLLSTAASGSLSLYYLGQQIFGAISQVLNKAIVSPLVPMLTELHNAGDIDGFRHVYHLKIMQMSAISLFGMVIFVIFGQDALSLLIGYGKLSIQSIEILWLILLLMLGQFAIGNVGMIMTAVFYSVGDTKSSTIAGAQAYTIGLLVKIVLFYIFGVLGLALAVTIHYVISLYFMSKKIREKKYI